MRREQYTDLEQLPNVGPAIAGDLRRIGILRPQALAGKDPYALYEKLCRVTGERHDPCVIDAFLSVVRFMEGAPAKPWWAYTAERKRATGQAPRRRARTARTRRA
jgi:hypothetical protein